VKLQHMVDRYVNYRQALGDRFTSAAKDLRAFARFIGPTADLTAVRPKQVKLFLDGRRPGTRSWHVPSLASKRVGPHTIRHTTATHLLRAGVDINTIRAWLGHASLATTNVYAEVDLEMKARALETCEIKGERGRKAWRQNAGVMEFLRNL
jgi:integrase